MLDEQIEERPGGERLWAQHPDPGPRPGCEQLQRDDRVDRRLPHDRLRAVTGHRPSFSRVTLPLITPGILAAALLSFALSIDDFIITYFNAGSEETFPLRIFSASRVEISPQINVLATIVLLVSVALMLAGVALRRRQT